MSSVGTKVVDVAVTDKLNCLFEDRASAACTSLPAPDDLDEYSGTPGRAFCVRTAAL